MKTFRIAGLGVLLFLLLYHVGASAPQHSAKPVALVYSFTGEATVTIPSEGNRPLRLLDRLPEGTTVKVGPGSRLELAFANGRRYELGERSRATLGRSDLASRNGSARPLSRVSPFPRIEPIAEEDHPGLRAGAVRIRAERIAGLYPRNGTATLAEATTLRFRPVDGAGKYKIEVQDRQGNVVLATETTTSPVKVSPRILKPGMHYGWTVRTIQRVGPVARGEADFVTLPAAIARQREALRKSVEAAGDNALLTLLAEVDRSLGLLAEAREALRAALQGTPGHAALAEALAQIERRMGDENPGGTGVVIEEVKPGSAGEAVGLQPGDIILSWSCAASPPVFPSPSSGRVSSPYDLLPVELEEAPRRGVTLRGKRGDQDLVWTLRASEWGLATRPNLPDDLAALYSEGKARIEGKDFAAAERSWRSAAESARTAGDGPLAAWFLHRLASALAEAGKWPEADAAYGEALTSLEREPEPFAAADLLRSWAKAFERRGVWDAAIELFQKALVLDRTTASESLAEALTLNNLGITIAKRGDYSAAEELLQQALAIREKLAPGTAEVTGSLNNLGTLARRRGDLAAAEEYLTRGEELQRRLAPGNANHALFFQNLGNLAGDRGDLESAEGFYSQALEIFEKTAPGGDGVVDCLYSLATVAMQRGDLAIADNLLRRSLAVQEHNEWGLSETLIILGHVASRRGDLEAAEAYYRRALAIQKKFSPDGPEVAASMSSLGIVMAAQGDFTTARAYMQHSLAIIERLAPESLDVAAYLENLGLLELTDSGGDLATAESLLRRGLMIFESKKPESLETSDILRDLGEVAARSGRLPEALALHRRALDLRRKLAPQTTGEADALYLLGGAELRAGSTEEGTRDLCRAIDILDHQRGRIGGTQEAKALFEATLGDYYQACLAGLIELSRPSEAFHALERGRARSFLSLLTERVLRVPDLPPELAAERRHVNAEYDNVQSQLARLSAGRDDAEIERLTGEMRDLRTRQEEIIARIRRESPRSASLHYPEPLDLAGTRTTLDPGTVLLEYAVGEERTWLFVVQPTGASGPGLSVFPIAAGTKALREEVESFRRLLERPGSHRAALRARARHLYDLLIRPAKARIARAQRILISPDGPLHTLAFAALMRGNSYLIEWKPVHSVLSATVYAELARSRPPQRKPEEERLTAFADPFYPSTAPQGAADPEVGEAVRRGLSLQPLPSTREEVQAIASLYPQAQVFVGREATEERVKSLRPESRLVHFACHGLLDERFPLNSGLALSLPEQRTEGQDNGLLQAWEIFESVRIDADLVTLSACDTALGKEMGGEGLIGLTRAFQYAGARSVLASLWGVSDASTTDLMKRFYSHLRKGKSKDQALQAAQVELMRSPRKELSHPYHWAAFQLVGDWK